MMHLKKRVVSLLLILALVFSTTASVWAAAPTDVSDYLKDVAAFVLKTTPNPQVGSIGGEWAVLGLARADAIVPANYYENYYRTVERYVKECDGVLSTRKYTEYSRVILALTAIGKDPSDVAGYNLLVPLGDYEKTVWQGINGGIFALLALDSGNYDMPMNATSNIQATRSMYVDFILEREILGGGWSLAGDEADADITGMALQALAKYQDRADVKKATDRALTKLSAMQDAAGGYSSYGVANCESAVQVLVALNELGISLNDPRFVKNGNTLADNLLLFYQKGKGFTHIVGGGNGADGMSTEQGLYALASISCAQTGESLYRMAAETAAPAGITNELFSDVAGHPNQEAIETLAEKKIINGKGDGTFAPNATMDRAEFCTIAVLALDLKPSYQSIFSDVASGAWYGGYVSTAYSNGIVSGSGNGKFDPGRTITRQEAASMVTRAAKVLGMDTAVTDSQSVLAQYADGASVAGYFTDAVAFCCKANILQAGNTLRPDQPILRGEIAQMIFNLLKAAGKI